MYPAPFEYFAPRTVEDALAMLARYGDEAKILAGGQSLLPMMKLRIASPRYLIDVNGIAALGGLRMDGDRLRFGSLCRHADIGASSLVEAYCPLMTDAARLTADVQVRNRGTIGGSLAHADPAGDWPTALLALDADVTIAGPGGLRTMPLERFLVDAYTTALGAGDMLTEVSVPVPPSPGGGAYVKFEKRAGDFAVASVGVQLALGAEGRCRGVAISLGALGPMPMRVRVAEALLGGAAVTPALLEDAADLVRAQA